jgi:hypothetical protein
MEMSAKILRQVRQRFSDEILGQACQWFGFARTSLEPLEGSAFIYQGFLDEKSRIRKITPGVHANGQVMGSTRERAAAAFAETFKDKPGIQFLKMDAARMDFPDVFGGRKLTRTAFAQTMQEKRV